MSFSKVFAFATIAVLAGCAETAGTRVTVDTHAGEASVFEGSMRLSNRVKVVRTTYSEVGGGIKKASVTIQSLTHRRQHLQARMVWLDAEGVAIDSDAKPFRSIVLDGQDTYVFTGVAPSAKASVAKMVIRENDTAE
jgi:uncharacterized protein YcfL